MPSKRNTTQAKKSPSAVVSGAAGKRKKLSFNESTLKAASSCIQTTHIDTAVKFQPKKGAKLLQQHSKQQGKPAPKASAPAATVKRRGMADMKGSGIVKAKAAAKRAEHDDEEKKEKAVATPTPTPTHDDDDDSSDDEADMLNGVTADGDYDDVSGDDLSDVAARSSSSDDEGGETAASTKKSAGKGSNDKSRVVAPYRVVRLSFLPPEFQEPQLYKFLNQFGATVLNCFCVRSKRTHRSKGVAYVEFDKESVIPLVVEECNGMALGGMSVRARPVTMHRPMPSRKLVTRRRALAYAYRTKGAPLKHHNVSKKSAVALLIKAAKMEKVNNAHLQKLGVDFRTDFFQSQLKSLPAGLLIKKAKRKAAKKATESPKAAPKKAAPKK
jgi:hypothetical protein